MPWLSRLAISPNAAQVGIDEAHGDLLPEDKRRTIEARTGRDGAIGMAGDGINDAPALALSDIGFALGAAGTRTAIETADVGASLLVVANGQQLVRFRG